MIKFRNLHNRNLKILSSHYFSIFLFNLTQTAKNQEARKYLNYLIQLLDQKLCKTILDIISIIYQANSSIRLFDFILYCFASHLNIQMHYQKNLLKILLFNALFLLDLTHFN